MKKIIKVIAVIFSIVLLNNAYNNIYASDLIASGTARYEGEFVKNTELFNSERDERKSYLGRQILNVNGKEYNAFCIDAGHPISTDTNAYKLYSGNRTKVESVYIAERYGRRSWKYTKTSKNIVSFTLLLYKV